MYQQGYGDILNKYKKSPVKQLLFKSDGTIDPKATDAIINSVYSGIDLVKNYKNTKRMKNKVNKAKAILNELNPDEHNEDPEDNFIGVFDPKLNTPIPVGKKEKKKYNKLLKKQLSNNYSEDTMFNKYYGNSGVAIVGNGAEEALIDTMGEYALYAEDPEILALGVDALRSAQVLKLDNGEYFAESEPVALEDCIYSVGDLVEVTPELRGYVVEVMPLPESFSDSTVTHQVVLDNGVLANVTESGNLWVEMSEDGECITTPLVKYNYINVEGEVFSTIELGLIDPDSYELASFSIDDYIDDHLYEEMSENFSEQGDYEDYGYTNDSELSDEYVVGATIARDFSDITEGELVNYSYENGLDYQEVLRGFADGINYYDSVVSQNFSQQEPIGIAAPDYEGYAQYSNFSEDSYNYALDEVASWVGNNNI